MSHEVNPPLAPEEAERALALFRIGEDVGGHEFTAADADGARRILTGELSPQAAQVWLGEAFTRIVAAEQRYLAANPDADPRPWLFGTDPPNR